MKGRVAGAPVADGSAVDPAATPVLPQPILETDRLRLAPLVPADAPEVQELASAFEIHDMTLSIPHPYPEGAALRWIESIQSSWASGRGGSWSIRLRDDGPDGVPEADRLVGGRLVGVIHAELQPENGSAELGYWIGVPFWGRGYVTEAVRAVIEMAFATLGLNRVSAHHFVRNPASGRVLAKSRMRAEGTLRQVVRKHEHYEDVTVWGILRSDWEATR